MLAGSFKFIGSGELILGKGKFSELLSLTDLKSTALICGNSFLSSRQYKLIKNLVPCQFTIKGEPDPDTIDEITKEVKGKVKSVLAIGGGSALDAGKAISAMCCSNGSIENYLEGIGSKKPEGKTLPVIAVPTTAGTGSEATKNAVICRRGENGYKKSIRHNNYIPPHIIIDPELYMSCPLPIIRSCGMDAFSQLLESYLSTKSNEYTDILAWKGLTLFIDSFMELCSTGNKKISLIEDIAFGAYLSGITLANAGLGTIHGIAGPMGGYFDIPHGTACGILLPEVLKKTIYKLRKEKNNKYLARIEKLESYILRNTNFKKEKDKGMVLTEMIEAWLENIETSNLSAFGINELSAEKIALVSGNKNNPVQFNTEEIKSMIINRI